MTWLGAHHPSLVSSYRALYGSGAYPPRAYQQQIAGQVRDLAAAAGVGRASPAQARRVRRRASGKPHDPGRPPQHGTAGQHSTAGQRGSASRPAAVQLSLL
jgi:hypothetical protein